MKVKFVPQNIECEIKPGQSVLHVAQDNQVYIKSVCRGVPSCAECRVRILEGDHNVLPPSASELSLIGTGHFIDRRRLSCQLKCFGDIIVDLTEQVEKEKQILSGKPRGKGGANDSFESHAIMGNILAVRPEQISSPSAISDAGSPAPPSKSMAPPPEESRNNFYGSFFEKKNSKGSSAQPQQSNRGQTPSRKPQPNAKPSDGKPGDGRPSGRSNKRRRR